MAYKQQPKSPVLKALVGDQHTLPKVLKDAILASPAKQTIGPKQTPSARRKTIKDANKTYSPDKVKALEKKLSKDRKDTGKVYGPESAKALKNFERKKIANTVKSLKKDRDPNEKVYKDSSPAKQSTYRGGYYKTDAQMADRQRRVDEGLPVRRKDYAPGREGQKAFNADRSASMHNRIAWRKDLRSKVISGEITAKEAGKARRDFGKEWQKNASSKRTKADRDKNDAISTYVWTGKGFKRKVSDAEKASYESVSGGKSPAKQTTPPKSRKKISAGEKLTGKKPKAKETFRDGPVGPYRTSPKVKNKGQKKTLDGNVIKYSKNSPAKKKNPSSGFDGYTKIASSKNSNVIAAKKAAASRKNPKSTYKFTKDKKTGETHLYQKG